MSRYKDFDAYFAELNREPVVFRYKGEEFILPPELPAIVPIKVMALQKQYGSDADIPADDIIEIAKAVFGEEYLNKLLGMGITMSEFGEIIQWVIGVYNGVEVDDAQNPPSPEKG